MGTFLLISSRQCKNLCLHRGSKEAPHASACRPSLPPSLLPSLPPSLPLYLARTGVARDRGWERGRVGKRREGRREGGKREEWWEKERERELNQSGKRNEFSVNTRGLCWAGISNASLGSPSFPQTDSWLAWAGLRSSLLRSNSNTGSTKLWIPLTDGTFTLIQ